MAKITAAAWPLSELCEVGPRVQQNPTNSELERFAEENGHSLTIEGITQDDTAVCSCGWRGQTFWDGCDLAQKEWLKKHIAAEYSERFVQKFLLGLSREERLNLYSRVFALTVFHGESEELAKGKAVECLNQLEKAWALTPFEITQYKRVALRKLSQAAGLFDKG